MDPILVMPNLRVSDLAAAEGWWSTLVGRGPDERPMDGLLEWRLGAGAGLQVWREPEAAGRSGCTISVTDLDAVAARLTTAGVAHEGVEQASSVRILRLADPDGNRVVLTD
ncbi:VOC family protein [Arthrobacter sp. NEB 688]|uniref:VOC family protein n=1 Tax=Arthrobacter sp. NEB 688 TaxID=904039 RepID=UPI001564842E|nr:VOC family protein [Arthrobacter sp. NEB 688]QKE85182.1 VOC family protein [Arthrobacter sp. NEB 688]